MHSPMGGSARKVFPPTMAKKSALPKIAAPEMDQDTDQDESQDQQPKDITSDPQAMELVEELKSLGYTAEDVAQAFESDTSSDEGSKQVNTTGASGFGSNIQLPPMKG